MSADSSAGTWGFARHFSQAGVHPFDTVEWEFHDASITNLADGHVVFHQPDTEFPTGWSPTARNIVAQKYFRGTIGEPNREWSLRQVVDRVAGTIAGWALADGYFDEAGAAAFGDELRWLLLHQRVAFNSPVWFNIGVEGVPQQASACFILAVDDTMESILNWYVEEGRIFKGGSGSGVNLSSIRGSQELLAGGGAASGPVSFMRGADASAGTIRSGGKTRRAAKMVLLDADHPDVGEFIWCKAREERKARALADAGFDMSLDGADAFSVQYQNANNSVRLSDEFMEAVEKDDPWPLVARTTGEVVEVVRARELFGQVAAAAWECADPGVHFSTTINSWHTAPATGPITASNPCSEYLHLDNSACNLASVNLLAFLGEAGRAFDAEGFAAAVRTTFIAQDVLVGRADYPTEAIGDTSRRFRQLGLGFTNLGALLLSLGVPYDSPDGRALAGAVTALLCGEAYACSAAMATRLGPFEGFGENAAATQAVLERHAAQVEAIGDEAAMGGFARPFVGELVGELADAARAAWKAAVDGCAAGGVRNSQATVIAPTGTISFMMDCDTTGIEPDLALVKRKKLVGGGDLPIVNRSVGSALRLLGYAPAQVADVEHYLLEHGSVLGAPHLREEHLPVFACSIGDNVIAPEGHVRMMAAVQPFVSGAISKTVNLPEETTVEAVEDLLMLSWRLGLKAVAVYRDNCKLVQPVTAEGGTGAGSAVSAGDELLAAADGVAAELVGVGVVGPKRERLPRERTSKTVSFRVADCHGYLTVGEYSDGRPGEIFLKVAKQGSTLAGIMDALAISVSHGLQHGVPLRSYVETFSNIRFEPAGITDDPELRIASSLIDYIFKRLALDYLSPEERRDLGVLSVAERSDQTLPGMDEARVPSAIGEEPIPDPPSGAARSGEVEGVGGAAGVALAEGTNGHNAGGALAVLSRRDAPMCSSCGDLMVRAGSCFACMSCGNTSGCG